MDEMFGFVLFAAVLAFFLIVLPIRNAFKRRRGEQETQNQQARNEALFRSMFPELQPHFHPERLLEFARARLDRSWSARTRWTDPPGFPAATVAELAPGERDRERVRLLDAAGKPMADFTFEKHAEGGVIRVGKGKFTVDIRKPAEPRVRYWHPDREFKWSRAGWVFKTAVADEPFESSSSSSSFSSTSSSTMPAAAAAAGIVGLGGSFDGGGAAGSWDEAAPGASSASAAADTGGSAVVGATAESTSDSTGDAGSDASSDSGSTAY